MTRFRICVNPELRGVHLHIVAAVFSPSAYADDEKEENEGMLKWKWGDKSKRSK